MLKIIQKQLDTSLIRLSLITAIIYNLLFNSSIFIHNYLHYKTSFLTTIFGLMGDFVQIYIFLCIMFFGLTVHRLVFIIGTVLLFVSGSIASYYLFFYRTIPNKEMIKLFFSTQMIEIPELVSVRLIVWMIFSLSIALYIIKHFKVENTPLFLSRLLSALCLLFTLNCVISPPYKILKNYFPVQYLHNSYLYFTHKTSIKHSLNEHENNFLVSNGKNFNG